MEIYVRFDDHRGRESYRPTASRGYSRHTSPARTRSPRLVADTWVPPSNRPYGRFRDRSPLPYRCRSRSPTFRQRDGENNPYTHTAQRKLSPRREIRPRSPQFGWRSRSPYRDRRPRDVSRGRSTPSWRDPTPPKQDLRLLKRERGPQPPPDHYKKSASPMRHAFLRNSNSHPLISHNLRTPPEGPPERSSGNATFQTRQSPSVRDASSIHISAPSTVSNSRRPSPTIDRPNATAEESRGRSPAECYIPQRRASRSSIHSTPSHVQMDVGNERDSQDKSLGYSSLQEQPCAFPDGTTALGIKSTQPTGPSIESDCRSNHASPNALSTQLNSSHGRGPTISLLSAPTRPRGGSNTKENFRTGVSTRRGLTFVPSAPPTGPRNSHTAAVPVDSHRPHIHRHNSLAGPSWPRTQKHTNHLAGLCAIIPGGRLLACDVATVMEKRLGQLDSDKDRLFEQITDSQRLKRLVSQEWDRLDRESSICVLKSELAEGHLQRITDGESINAGTTF
ncbi:uncharacterized protein ACLA_000710 [Aspergillus clavatus NRRL 1]|uniref:Serine/arginine repetitive matrix protein 1 n=1 Tax=Aspergillus clavatus (strain ATCC 1007 / CBS 513.65 / DSM 816 / NCTC 3887 / NRRL 1 / QM 1276 / 107) TaxID=344612 RepID=A1C4P2_ASPCL|nr:uncharacterized protein ACLA_000710 [Aspergillus clavatus NRRL 1]EAW14660.1 conserved hypothetical protein [Aspergillus clavatus NRRL 1]